MSTFNQPGFNTALGLRKRSKVIYGKAELTEQQQQFFNQVRVIIGEASDKIVALALDLGVENVDVGTMHRGIQKMQAAKDVFCQAPILNKIKLDDEEEAGLKKLYTSGHAL